MGGFYKQEWLTDRFRDINSFQITFKSYTNQVISLYFLGSTVIRWNDKNLQIY